MCSKQFMLLKMANTRTLKLNFIWVLENINLYTKPTSFMLAIYLKLQHTHTEES